jgi:hypothetical protein
MTIAGSIFLVVKPDWFDGRVPGTKYFNLVPAGSVYKFMDKNLAYNTVSPSYTALGADHCNQTGIHTVFKLEEITLNELNSTAGGKKRRQSRKSKKGKKSKKTRLGYKK